MKKFTQYLMLMMLMLVPLSLTSCSDKNDDGPSDYASEIAGVYSGKLTSGTWEKSPYVVSIYRVSSTVVSVDADFLENNMEKFSIEYSNGTYSLSSSTHSNITFIVQGNTLSISFLNGNNTITQFTGYRDR